MRREEWRMHAQDPSPRVTNQEPIDAPASDGPDLFAGTMLVVAGIWHGLIGLAGLAHDTLLVRVEGYVYAVDLTAWAWAHLVLGVVVAAVGVAVRRGQSWAWIVGLLLVGLSLVVNFIFIPHQPVWSGIVICLDVVIVFALSMGRPRAA
jgi:hypothetical protein